MHLQLPPGCEGELVLPVGENVALPVLRETETGLARYRLAAGSSVNLNLART